MFIGSANKFETSSLIIYTPITLDIFSSQIYFHNCFTFISKKKKKKLSNPRFDLIQISYGENHFIYRYIQKRLARPTKRSSFYSRNPRSSNPFSGGKERGCPFPAYSRKFSKDGVFRPFTRGTRATRAWIKLADVQLEFFTSSSLFRRLLSNYTERVLPRNWSFNSPD